jgi:hypothetical protein
LWVLRAFLLKAGRSDGTSKSAASRRFVALSAERLTVYGYRLGVQGMLPLSIY